MEWKMPEMIPEEISAKSARALQTSDLIVGLSTAAAAFIDLHRTGGPAGARKSVEEMLTIRVQMGQMTEEDVEVKAKEAWERANAMVELTRTTLEVYTAEINRRIPIPEEP